MTAEQVEHVNITQQSVDKRFGDLAVELGYVTADDVEKLLAQQPTDYLLLGQTLVNNGALTNAEFEKALKDYKAENQITDDISDNQTETLHNLINEFYHFDNDENARICTDYVTLLFKNLIRFIGDDFTPMEASVIKNFAAEHIVIQKINGKYNAEACIATDSKTYMAFAERFAKESFTEVDDFVNATAGEFLNVNDGLFVVNESNEHGVELTLTPQEFLENGELVLSGTAFCIPVNYPFGKLNFIIARSLVFAGNEELVFPLVLESALTISILAVGIEQTHHIARSYLHRLHIEYQVLGFGSVSAYVLYGTGSHFARNEREVFGSVPSVGYALSHDIVPRHARTVAYEHVVGSLGTGVSHHHRLVAYGRMNHNAFEVAGEKQVTALADDDKRHVSMGEDARHLTRLVYSVKLKKATASCLDAERIVRQKAAIEYVLHYIISFISFQCLPLRRKVSSVSRPLAMPRMTNIF